jgi:lupus La protein
VLTLSQVEFYFSTHNLVTDKHLFEELDGPENRPVSIKHIADFKRMRRFKPYSAVVNALRESKDLVVVDDGEFNGVGKEAVKRTEPITVPKEEGDAERKPTTEELFNRLVQASSNRLETSVYAKNFGEADEAGQIALEQFFLQYGAVMVRKRRDADNNWKGSVFIEFDSEDSQKQFLALDPAPKFNDNELVTMGKKEYNEMKCKEKGIEPDSEEGRRFINGRGNHNNSNRGGRGGRGGRGDRGGRGGRGDGRGRGRGGYDRRDDRRNDDRRDRRRDRSASNGSVESRDWNNRRDRFQKGKDDRGSRKEEERKEIERDGHGVPVVKDSRTDAEIAAAAKKRKGDDEERADSPKKNKLEIKQDE